MSDENSFFSPLFHPSLDSKRYDTPNPLLITIQYMQGSFKYSSGKIISFIAQKKAIDGALSTTYRVLKASQQQSMAAAKTAENQSPLQV